MGNKKIPAKNYIIVFIIAIVTIFLIITLSVRYKNQEDYKYETDITFFLSEIKWEEIDNFIVENHDIMIYIVNSNDDSFKELQTKVKKIISKNNYNKDIVVLNIKDQTEENLNTLKEKYFDTSLKNFKINHDNLLIIKNGKVLNIFEVDNNSIDGLKDFIEKNFYGEE